MPADTTALLQRLYERFNVRDIEAVLALMRADVMWANGMEGGHVHGRDAVRDYWTRQWAVIDPHVTPSGFTPRADGAIDVTVRQTVRDLDGKVLSEKSLHHIFRVADGLVSRFDIA
jgi:ketosteroid isomerase-like protein